MTEQLTISKKSFTTTTLIMNKEFKNEQIEPALLKLL
jgi:hypothetical protein